MIDVILIQWTGECPISLGKLYGMLKKVFGDGGASDLPWVIAGTAASRDSVVVAVDYTKFFSSKAYSELSSDQTRKTFEAYRFECARKIVDCLHLTQPHFAAEMTYRTSILPLLTDNTSSLLQDVRLMINDCAKQLKNMTE